MEHIGHGGFSDVYKAYFRGNSFPYALKIFINRYNINTLLKEAGNLQLLNSCGQVPSLVDYGLKADQLWLVTDYLAGTRLDRMHIPQRNISFDLVLDLIEKLLRPIEFSHRRGLIHKDIKPNNIMINNGLPYLLDWGVADMADHNHQTIRANQDYVAPECYYGQHSTATDFYSLGWLVYYLLTGKKPYHFDDTGLKAYRIFAHCLEKPLLPSSLPEDAIKLIHSLIHKDPDVRNTGYSVDELLKTSDTLNFTEGDGTEIFRAYSNNEYIRLCALNGIPYAQHLYAKQLVDSGKHEEAASWLKRAGDKGYHRSLYELSVLYDEGKFVKKDTDLALDYLVKASDAGSHRAHNRLGWFYMKGRHVPRSPEKAEHLLNISASSGDSRALNNLGILHDRLKNNPSLACRYYRAAAVRGNPRAQNNLAKCLATGHGIEADPEQSIYWYRASASKGNSKACRILLEQNLITDHNIEAFYQQDFSPELQLLNEIRMALINPGYEINMPDGLKIDFRPDISQTYITIFQPGNRPIRWGSRRATLLETVKRIVVKLRRNEHLESFNLASRKDCRILLEVVTEERPCSIRNATIIRLGRNRLEPGIHGLKVQHEKIPTVYFMPTDSVTKSLMSIRQILNHVSKRTGIAKSTSSITERVEKMRRLPFRYSFIKSVAFVTFNDGVIPLYRGLPQPLKFSSQIMFNSIRESTRWLVKNMKKNGQFLYYYDPVSDSEIDFLHPGMRNPPYYNILRHAGGTITLLLAYELTGDPALLAAATSSVEFSLTTFRHHKFDGHDACYPFLNRKSKLGGAGTCLVALMKLARHIETDKYDRYIHGLVWHILSRIDKDGEMIGYFIHPLVNDGAEITNPTDAEKRSLFSFYYPGEALLGLTLFLTHAKNIPQEMRKRVHDACELAFDFLVDIRPSRYADLFSPLPSDSWLMQAIEQWYMLGGTRKRSYTDFVFGDADALIEHMYKENDSPFFDYDGMFYYEYGEHAYPDGARCEGLVSACYLARLLGDNTRYNRYLHYCTKAARSLMLTYHSEESTYSHRYPEKSIGSFRFKLTRQWVRVDSVQHTACFFSRLHPLLECRAES